MKTNYKRNMRLAFGLSIILLMSSATASYFTINKLLQSFTWVDHTNNVLMTLDNIMVGLIDGETAMRGYLLTRDDSFLEPYQGADQRVSHALMNVQLLTQDNGLQRRNIAIIKSLVEKEFRFMKNAIDYDLASVSEVNLKAGKNDMDAIRYHIATMKDVETRLMDIRSKSVSRQTGLTLTFIAIAMILSIVTSIVSYTRLTKNLTDMDNLQEQLKQKDLDTQAQISVIDKHAKKIADGDYSSRVDVNELTRKGNKKSG